MYTIINYVIAYRHVLKSGKTQREERVLPTSPEAL